MKGKVLGVDAPGGTITSAKNAGAGDLEAVNGDIARVAGRMISHGGRNV